MAVRSRAALTRKSSHSLLTGVEESQADEGAIIDLCYHTGWQKPCVHYRVLGTEVWTQLPGLEFTKANNSESFSATIQGKGIEFVCNDGIPTGWDKAPGNQNYFINNPGKYTLRNGRIEQQLAPPKAPALVVATEVGSTTVCLSWNPPEGMDEAEIG